MTRTFFAECTADDGTMAAQQPQFIAEPYIYEPLPTASSIRLVSIAKKRVTAPLESGSPLIECFVRTVDLDHLPPYKALSYTWGNPNGANRPNPAKDKYSRQHLYPISLNGRTFKVRLSLYEVLNYVSSSATANFTALNIDERTWGFNKSKLIRMAEGGRLQEVRDCLHNGANIHMQDYFGETALHYAAENGHVEVVRTLLEHGAKTDILDNSQRTPLACCLQRERGEWKKVAETLVDPKYIKRNEEQIELLGPALWIDGICIDQNNVRERNAQVALMARIYKAAITTRVWLGPEKEDTHIIQPILHGNPTGVEKRDVSREEIKVIGELLRRSWFRRKWVIQEFCLAGSVEIYCGKLVLGTNIAAFTALMASPVIRKAQAQGDIPWTALFELRPWIVRERAYRSNRIHLATLIDATWDFGTEDPRDAIFALLGILPPKTGRKNVHGVIAANYSRCISDIFTEAAKICVHATKGDPEKVGLSLRPLQALSWVRPLRLEVQDRRATRPHLGPGPAPDMPTWVPDFHIPRRGNALWSDRFSACGKRSTARFWPSEPRLLKVSGRYLDQLVQVARTTVTFKGTGLAYDVNLDIASWFEVLLHLDIRYQGICSRVEAFWKTLIHDYGAEIPQDVARASLKQLLRTLTLEHEYPGRVREQLASLRRDDASSLLPTDTELDTFAGPSELNGQSTDFKSTMAEATFTELFRTKNGYLGIGMPSIRKGDQIWVLDGSRVPFVLRPLSTGSNCPRYQFMGESYVHGVMYGEVMNKRPLVKVDSYTIEIE